MSALKTAALAAAILGGTLAAAEAQPYGHWSQGPQYGYNYRPAPPVYVHPRIARKQAQLQERFVEKYGYQQPGYGYGYHRPHRPHVHYWDGAPRRPLPPRPQTYYYGW